MIKANRRLFRPTCLTAAAIALLSVVTMDQPAIAAARQVAKSADDLPRYSYPISGRLADLLDKPAVLAPLADRLRADTESTLAKFQIEDRATVRELHRLLMYLALLRGDANVARREIAAVRGLQDKEAEKLTTGLRENAYLEALAAGPPGTPAFKARFQANYSAALAPLPWELVGSKLQETAGMAPVMTAGYLRGISDAQLQPAVTSGGSIDAEAAAQFIRLAVQYRLYSPLTAESVAALQAYIAKNAMKKADIWAARSATLPTGMKLTPVVVAVWDAGVDTAQFDGKLWTNDYETLNGKDDDGNGFVDDLHGVAFDSSGHREIAPLSSLPDDVAPRIDATRLLMQGMNDQQAGIDSRDARHVRELAGTASPEVIKRTFEDVDFYSQYAHGTHVAGIVADGNPAIRLLVVRSPFEWRSPPRRPTEATATAAARMYGDVVAYMKKAGVRVVNMSWTVGLKAEYEDQLAANGVPVGQREAEARRLFAIDSKGLRAAIAAAPEILFVCAAGNENDSATFSGNVPASIDAPNVITVAAVDQAGEPTGFTSGGPTVDVAASGYQVDSVLPGGSHQRWSGTSMASPAVVNAAAKLLTVDPTLTLEGLRRILLTTATDGTGGFRLLNAKAALSALSEKSASAPSPRP